MKREVTNSRISDHGDGLGTVTQEMVEKRAREIALANGRPPEKFNENDLAEARDELLALENASPRTDETGENANNWEDLGGPVPGETGKKKVTKPASDPQVRSEKMVEEGVEEAAHEQMVAGNKMRREADES